MGAVNKKDDSWKDGPVPPEFNQDVEAFRKFVKEQKGVSTDMSHLSLPKLHQKIRSDVEGLSAVVQQLGSGECCLLTGFCRENTQIKIGFVRRSCQTKGSIGEAEKGLRQGACQCRGRSEN